MPLADFLSSLRSRETEVTYGKGIRLLVGDGDAFVERVRGDRRMAEDFVISRIVEMRGRIKPPTLASYVAATKSFCEYEDVFLNWKRVKKPVPPARFHASDRCPTVEEIRMLLACAGRREVALALCMVSGGFRVGATNWFTVGDYVKLASGAGRLTVYRGEPEVYTCFVSPEACIALDSYLDERLRAGEKVVPSAPLFRDVFDTYSLNAGTVRHVDPDSLGQVFNRLWIKAGIRVKGAGRGEFKAVHGFRKFFKTRAEQVMKRNDVELLMGHLSSLDASYYKPPLDLLEKEYLKAVPLLTISEVVEVERKHTVEVAGLKDELKAHDERYANLYSELDVLKRVLKDKGYL